MKKRGFYLIILLMIAVTLLSSCGNKEEESGVSTYETRSTVEAIQGKDYRIDDIIVAIADSPNQNGDVQYISYDELKVLLQTKKEKGESIHCRVTIKYTALNELSGSKGGLSLNFWSFEGGQSIVQYSDFDGNGTSSSSLQKTKNVLPGEHYLSFDFSILNQEEWDREEVIENFDSIDDSISFSARVYAYTE